LSNACSSVAAEQPSLDDLEVARRLGRRLWEESDLQLDFNGVERVTPEFAVELCRTIVAHRSPAVLSNAFLVHTMAPEVQATFLPAIMAALGAGVPRPPNEPNRPAPGGEPAAAAALPVASATLDPFSILSAVQHNYLTYVQTFQRPEIRDWVMERVQSGTLPWKPPSIQISRPFAPGDLLEELVAKDLVHPDTPPISRRDPENAASAPVHPYRHQTEAIRHILGQERNVVVRAEDMEAGLDDLANRLG
jgi:hypothetical protein